MAYRLAPNIELVLVKDPRTGMVRYHYARPAPGSPDFGPDIPAAAISDEQAAMLLAENLIEQVDEPESDTDPTGDPDRVTECIDALARLGVPAKVGAPTARAALKEGSYRFENAVVCQAVKQRKSQLAETAAS